MIKTLKDLSKDLLILDGATGTILQSRGMPKGVCPEEWVLKNPDILIDIQEKYIEAGSDVIYTCTFGTNPIKLDEFGLKPSAYKMNKELAKISRAIAGNKTLVAGDLGPTGKFIKPFGDIDFEYVVNSYKEQVAALIEGGVDFFVIETMMDMQEARAALIAVKETTDLPVCVSMTFGEDKRTLTGTDPVTFTITLQELGADVIGCNCSTGPKELIQIIKLMKTVAKVPLLVKPNAGIPQIINGDTVFNVGPKEFSSYARDFINEGVRLIGGCCGTSYQHIQEIKKSIKGMSVTKVKYPEYSAVTSLRKTVIIDKHAPTIIIGERINPTGKKKLKEELKENKFVELNIFADTQIEQGADILDVNLGMPGIDEKELMKNVIQMMGFKFDIPLCIDSSSIEVIEAALRVYPGRALVNSISGETEKMKKLIPISKKYGAMFIILPLDERGVLQDSEQRIKIIDKVYNQATKYKFTKNDILVDALVMTASSDQKAGMEALKVIDWCTNIFNCSTVVGLSNISFGLPQREWLNAAFMAMCITRGVRAAIADPSSEAVLNIKMASDLLMGYDKNSESYIYRFSNVKKIDKSKEQDITIYNAVIKGNVENIYKILDIMIKNGDDVEEIVDKELIPAINKVGELYEKKEYFLPQLIQSAQAMKIAFDFLEPYLIKTAKADKKVVIVLATVKGDIHDIGKNIVGLMLKNFGFEVHDLGKDVDKEMIVDKALELNADMIGLSALMTTTMTEMKEVIDFAKKRNLLCKFIIGGAVTSLDYAKEIGAHGYARDAYEAVNVVKKLINS